MGRATSGVRSAMSSVGTTAGAGMAAAAGAAAGRSTAIGTGLTAAAGKVAKGGLLAAGVAAGMTVVSGFKSAVNQQDAETVLGGLYGSAKTAKTTLEGLRKATKSSPIEYSAYTKAAQSLAYAGVEGKKSTKILRNVGLVMAAAGGGSEEMGRATDAILKMVNNGGKAQLDTLNQLSETGVPVFDALSKKFGKGSDEIRKMASAGKIDVSDVLSVIENKTGKYMKSMTKAGGAAEKTFGNTFKAVKDDVTTSIGKALVPLLVKATPLLQRMGKWLQGAIPAGLSKVGGLAKTTMPYIKDMATALFRGQHGTGPFAVGSPVIQGLLTIRRAVVTAGTAVKGVFLKAFQMLRPHLVTFGQSMAGLWPDVKALGSAVGGFLKGAFQGILPILKIVGFVLGAVFVVALKLIPPVLRVVIKALTWLINLLKPFAGIIASVLLPLGLFRTGAVLLGKGLFTLGKWLVSLVGKIPGVSLAFRAVGAVARWLWSGAIKPAWAAITRAFSFLRASATTSGRVLNTVFRTIGRWATWLYAKAIRPAFTWIRTRIGAVAAWVRDVAGKIFSATFGRIGAAARALYTRGIRPAFQWITTRIGAVYRWVAAVVRLSFQQSFGRIGSAAKSLYTKGIRPAFQWITTRIGSVYRWFRDTVGASFSKTFGRIGSAAKWLYTRGIRPAFNWITSKIGSVYRWFRDTVGASFSRTLDGIKKAFSSAKTRIGEIWDGIKGIVAKPINAVIGFINKPLISGINKLLPKKMEIGNLKKIGGYDRGGWTGPGARLQPAGVVHADEFVVRKSSRRSIERTQPGLLDAMNRHGARALGYSTGGRVGSYYGQTGGYAKGGRVGGHSWPLIWNYVRDKFPGVRKTSDYRPGARSAAGPVSSHALGTAIDIGGPVSLIKRVMTHMRANFGKNMRDLIYTPLWGNKMIYMGREINAPAVTKRTHYNHGHIGLMPGRGLSGGGVPGGGGMFDMPDLMGPFKKSIGGLLGTLDSPLAKAPVEFVKSKLGDIGSWVTSKLGSLMPDGDLGQVMMAKVKGLGLNINRGGLIQKALGLLGLPTNSAALNSAVYYRVNKESTWDPNQTNNWDSNARAGKASRGLMQTIPSTFAQWRLPSLSNNIFDPLSNLVAGLRYALLDPKYNKWGSGSKRLIKVMRKKGGYVDGGQVKIPGFARGGVTKPGLSWVGERGPELISSPGGQRVYSNTESKQIGGRGDIHITINGVDTDNADDVVKALRYEMTRNGRYVGV